MYPNPNFRMVTCHTAGTDSDPLAGCSTQQSISKKGWVFLSQIMNSLETVNWNLWGSHRFLPGGLFSRILMVRGFKET